MKLLTTLLIVAAAFGQSKANIVQTGLVDARGAAWLPPTSTFASPPSSPATGSVYLFTDASAVGTCSGGGSALATCRWSGAAWAATGGGGSGSGTSVTTKGDLQGFDTAAARIPVGTNGQRLAADSTKALGLGWVTVDPTIPTCDHIHAAVSGANWSVTINGGSAATTAITGASNSQTLTIETLPAHSVVYTSRVYELVKFAGTGLSALTVSGGGATTTDYFPGKALVAAPCSTPGTLDATCVQFTPLGGWSNTDASHSFTLSFVATGTANMAALTAGSVDVSLCRGTLQ